MQCDRECYLCCQYVKFATSKWHKDQFGIWNYSGSHPKHIKCITRKMGICWWRSGATGPNVVYLRRLHCTHPSNTEFKRLCFLSGKLISMWRDYVPQLSWPHLAMAIDRDIGSETIILLGGLWKTGASVYHRSKSNDGCCLDLVVMWHYLMGLLCS